MIDAGASGAGEGSCKAAGSKLKATGNGARSGEGGGESKRCDPRTKDWIPDDSGYDSISDVEGMFKGGFKVEPDVV